MSKDFRGASGQEQSCELNRIKSPAEFDKNGDMNRGGRREERGRRGAIEMYQ